LFRAPPERFAIEVIVCGVVQAGMLLDVKVRIWPLVPADRNAVVLGADWYGRAPAVPPEIFAIEVAAVGVCQAGICADVKVKTWPLVPAAKNAVAFGADWYGTDPAAPPARFEASVAEPADDQTGSPPEDIVSTVPDAPGARKEVEPTPD
jgi:hypothetical protein